MEPQLAAMVGIGARITATDHSNGSQQQKVACIGSNGKTCHVEVMNQLTRRTFINTLAAAATMPSFSTSRAAAAPGLMRAIPSTGEQVPAIGLGTWITFNVGNDEKLRGDCARVV